MKIFYVTAFAKEGNRDWFSLGSQRKANQVISMLSELGFEITCLNIAPQSAAPTSPKTVSLCKYKLVPVRFIQIALTSFRFFLFSAELSSKSTIWLCNTRAAESIVAMIGLFLRPNLQLVLQQEDLPSARRANSGIAGWADYLSTRFLSKRANRIFAVSQSVANATTRMCNVPSNKINLIPPALDYLFIEKASIRSEPFTGDQLSILYAGSFNPDKGVTDLVRAFMKLVPGTFKLYLVGSAYIEFTSQYLDYNDIVFTGVLPVDELFDRYTTVDIVVNPHRSILNSDYVFPFKLMETIASGALPLTTPVPGCEIFGLPKECLFRGVDELTTKLSQSREIWQNNRKQIQCCANECRSNYSYEVIRTHLGKILKNV